MQGFNDKRGFFLQQPNHVLSRIADYLEERGFDLTDTDHNELQAIVDGYPSAAARKGYRVVELHPKDVGDKGQIIHTVFSCHNPTLAWEEHFDDVVQVATRLAQKRLRRPVLVLDVNDALVVIVDERESDQPCEHAVFVTQGALYDAEAEVPEAIASVSCKVDQDIPNLRTAYARFNERLRRVYGWDKYKGCVLYITAGPQETHIVHRTVL